MNIKLVLILSVLAIIIANTEAGNKEIRRGKARQPVAKIGDDCIDQKCPKGTSCRKVSFK